MFKENDCVVLTSELPSEGFLPGNVGRAAASVADLVQNLEAASPRQRRTLNI
jgi:hypothetical protein